MNTEQLTGTTRYVWKSIENLVKIYLILNIVITFTPLTWAKKPDLRKTLTLLLL